MINQHLLLFFVWMLFCLLHSVFASDVFKQRAQLLMKSNYKFYRIAYSLFALITLGFAMSCNFTMHSFLLWNVIHMEEILAVAGIIICGLIMLLFTKRFFFDLSGADVFRKKPVERTLIKTSLYKFVRHPLYSATLGFIWFIFLYNPLLSNLISCLCITVYTIVGIFLEEKKLITEFGENYLKYRSETPMLIPAFF